MFIDIHTGVHLDDFETYKAVAMREIASQYCRHDARLLRIIDDDPAEVRHVRTEIDHIPYLSRFTVRTPRGIYCVQADVTCGDSVLCIYTMQDPDTLACFTWVRGSVPKGWGLEDDYELPSGYGGALVERHRRFMAQAPGYFTRTTGLSAVRPVYATSPLYQGDYNRLDGRFAAMFLADDLWKVESDIDGNCAACSVVLPANYVTLSARYEADGETFLQLEREARAS